MGILANRQGTLARFPKWNYYFFYYNLLFLCSKYPKNIYF